MRLLRNLTLILFGILFVVFVIGCSEDAEEIDNVNNTDTSDVVVLSGTMTEDLKLTKDKKYLLRGGVFIGADGGKTATLTIEPGTIIYGESATKGMLVINRGSKIIAEGTASEPIVFTSDKPVGSRTRGDWGGLIINGRAPLNTGEEAYGEGGTGYYGGNNPNDSSGILKYVRVEFAGREISPDNELNGIAFQGVGSGTIVDYVQVHMNADDGIEMFGGTVNIKHALITGVADDCFDWTDGWQGKAQFLVCQHYGDEGDNGIEADNSHNDNMAKPISNPTIYNITLIGSPGSEKSDTGILLREGTKARIYNAIVLGWGESGLDIDHQATFDNAKAGELIVDNSIFFDNKPENFSDDTEDKNKPELKFSEKEFAKTMMKNNLEATQSPIIDPYNHRSPNFKSTGPALSHPAKTPPSDGFFESVNFIGGVGSNDWTLGWTTSAPN